jgi:hypothetical protein
MDTEINDLDTTHAHLYDGTRDVGPLNGRVIPLKNYDQKKIIATVRNSVYTYIRKGIYSLHTANFVLQSKKEK